MSCPPRRKSLHRAVVPPSLRIHIFAGLLSQDGVLVPDGCSWRGGLLEQSGAIFWHPFSGHSSTLQSQTKCLKISFLLSFHLHIDSSRSRKIEQCSSRQTEDWLCRCSSWLASRWRTRTGHSLGKLSFRRLTRPLGPESLKTLGSLCWTTSREACDGMSSWNCWAVSRHST